MQTKLNINNSIAQANEPRIGGKSMVSSNVKFPLTTLQKLGINNSDPKLLFSIPIEELGIEGNKEYYCSVFFSFDEENYQHVSYMADFYRDKHIGSFAIIHELVENNREDGFFIPSKLLTIERNNDKLPEWIQDPIEWEGYQYVCELDCIDFDIDFPSQGMVFDEAIGYLFIKNDWKLNEVCGAFLLQSR